MLNSVDEYFDTSDFAQLANFDQGAVHTVIPVIFDAAYQVSNIGDIAVQNAAPRVTCKSSDVAGANHTGTITISSVVYKIVEVQPDGTGITELVLSKD